MGVLDGEPDPWQVVSDTHERWLELDPVTQPDAKSAAHEAWQAALQRANRSMGVR